MLSWLDEQMQRTVHKNVHKRFCSQLLQSISSLGLTDNAQHWLAVVETHLQTLTQSPSSFLGLLACRLWDYQVCTCIDIFLSDQIRSDKFHSIWVTEGGTGDGRVLQSGPKMRCVSDDKGAML